MRENSENKEGPEAASSDSWSKDWDTNFSQGWSKDWSASWQKSWSETNFDKTVAVDPARLRLVKITHLYGRTEIVGTNTPQIRLRAKVRGEFNYTPTIEVRNEGREVEIAALPGKNFKFGLDFDNDLKADHPKAKGGEKSGFETSFEAGNEPEPGQFSDDPQGRENYRRAREEYRRARQEYRDTRQRYKDDDGEKSRDLKDQFKESKRSGNFWTNFFGFDPELIGDVARSFFSGAVGDLYIEVPNGVELEVKSVSGAVFVSDMLGLCRVSNTSGSVRLQNLRGGLQLKGNSGNVEAYRLGGRVQAKIVSGNLNLIDCDLTALDLSNTSGNISVQAALVEPDEGDYKINSTSAHVGLFLPANTRATLECRSLSGRIVAAPQFGQIEYRNRPGQNQARLEMNGGGRRVSINTLSGTIELGVFQPEPGNRTMPSGIAWPVPAPSTPPVPPVPPVPPTSFGPGWGLTPPAPPVAGPEPVTPPPPTNGWPTPLPSAPARPANQPPLVTPPPANSFANSMPVADTTGNGQSRSAASAAPERMSDEQKKSRQLEILRAIERGEVSVEEGLARLGALD